MVAYDKGASGIGGDASASYDLVIDKLTVAVTWRNLNRPEIRWETGATDNLEPTVNGGIAYRFVPNHVISVEASETLKKDAHLAAGWEGLFFNKVLSLRAGAFELDKHINPTAGFGVTYKAIRFDYAIEQHYALGLTSMFSLTIKFCPKLWVTQKVEAEEVTPPPVAPPPPVETPKTAFQQIEEEAKNEKLEVKTENNKITITVRVNFDFDKYNVKDSELPKVESVYRVLKNHTDMNVRVDGHTDSKGNEIYNQKLSENRAKEVMNELINMGIPAERLTYAGMGLTKPVASNLSENGRFKNRRVEFVIER
jgi:outer membrane protein OmpA-like peptidoglycan-associated protein